MNRNTYFIVGFGLAVLVDWFEYPIAFIFTSPSQISYLDRLTLFTLTLLIALIALYIIGLLIDEKPPIIDPPVERYQELTITPQAITSDDELLEIEAIVGWVAYESDVRLYPGDIAKIENRIKNKVVGKLTQEVRRSKKQQVYTSPDDLNLNTPDLVRTYPNLLRNLSISITEIAIINVMPIKP